MGRRAMTAKRKMQIKKWQAAGAASRRARSAAAAHASPTARRKRFKLAMKAMRTAGYGKGKDPFGMSVSAKIARYDKANSVYRELLKKNK